MKSLVLRFVILVASIGVLGAEESLIPAGKFRSGRTELRWPEIKDPETLIELAKTELAALKSSGKGLTVIEDPAKLKSLDGLYPYQVEVSRDFLFILLDTSPYTGQAVLISTDPDIIKGRYKDWWAKVEDTKWPQIKFALIKLRQGGSFSDPALTESYVRWRSFKLVDPQKNTAPVPIVTETPGYPYDMRRAGVVGEVQVEFVVTVDGLASGLRVKASHVEFERPVRDALARWKFEPAVDLATRLPVAAEVSVSATFVIDD